MKIENPYINFHINNGGIAFFVDNSTEGAVLVIQASHFGVQTNEIRLPVTPESLADLARFLKARSGEPMYAHQYNPVKVYTSGTKEKCCSKEDSGSDCAGCCGETESKG